MLNFFATIAMFLLFLPEFFFRFSRAEMEAEIDLITIAVNAGASLSAPESALIVRYNHQCEYMGSSERVPKATLCRGKRKA